MSDGFSSRRVEVFGQIGIVKGDEQNGKVRVELEDAGISVLVQPQHLRVLRTQDGAAKNGIPIAHVSDKTEPDGSEIDQAPHQHEKSMLGLRDIGRDLSSKELDQSFEACGNLTLGRDIEFSDISSPSNGPKHVESCDESDHVPSSDESDHVQSSDEPKHVDSGDESDHVGPDDSILASSNSNE